MAYVIAAGLGTAYADSTGERHPSATAAVGGGLLNATNAFVCNGAVAQATANNRVQDYSSYGFSIPAEAIIKGIQVRLRANDGTANNRRAEVSLSWNNGTSFTAALRTSNFKRESPLKDYILGSASYSWGRTWLPGEFANGVFRVRLDSKFGSTADPANFDCLPVTVTYTLPSAPDLSIAKIASPNPVQPGQNIVYTITYSNAATAPVSATGVVISDLIPANTTFVSGSPPPSTAPPVGGTGTVTWNIGSLAPGATGSRTLTVKVNAGVASGTEITNTTYAIDSTETTANPGSPVSTTVTTPIVLTLHKGDTPDPVRAGTTLVYTLNYSNQGTAPATSVVVTDSYSPDVTFVSAFPAADTGTNDQWTLGTLAPGASGKITISTTVRASLPTGTLILNTADIGSAGGHTASSSSVTTVNNSPGLTVDITGGPNPVASGSTLQYLVSGEYAGLDTGSFMGYSPAHGRHQDPPRQEAWSGKAHHRPDHAHGGVRGPVRYRRQVHGPVGSQALAGRRDPLRAL